MPTRGLRRGSIAVGAVAFVAGILFATSASVFAGQESSSPRDLRGLVAAESKRLEDRNAEIEELRAEVTALQSSLDVEIVPPTDAEALALGLVAVAGPGLRVTLDDAPATATSENNDDLVVHQQDLQGVVNALWSGGAEAVTIQGQRVVSTTAVRCVGNVLLLHGRTYSPPYVVEAIGDADALERAIDEDASVGVYLDYVEQFDLGWHVEKVADLTLPAYTGARTLNYAVPAEETP
ncbi:MAG: DUF881 domain-containing protein [Salana multivorans]|uniref:DUF881 domain-containing protein n=1 Tax=Salana multivorans TaxID=120377 RepID=UPI00095F9FE5|nr:DUF881 domain-containing protein [Salana multivorans]MBN8883719.1 DUF881 domain-containing protein [Salana multivorans]OJX96873.1 MAG: hypothetical protein BGO96_01965 [Micrococcales bacterium 73-15]